MAKLNGKLVKFELNKKGVNELLRTQGLYDDVAAHAQQKARQAGAGYSYEMHVGKNRIFANIFPNTKEAARDNWLRNTLEKVIRN